VFAVTAGVQLAGLTADAFAQDSVTAAFLTTAASSMGVSPASVAITSDSAVPSPSSSPLRRLAQAAATPSGLQVDYQVYLLTAAAASGVASRITTSGGPSLAALQAAGVPTTGVLLTTLPSIVSILAPPTPPAPAPPPPAPPPPAGCGSSWFCFAGVACTSASTCGACPPGMAGDGVRCSPCWLRVAITPSFTGNSTASAADVTLAGVVSAAEATCNVTGGFSFAWSATATAAAGGPLALAAAPVRGASGPALTLPARSLAGNGQVAAFALRACVARAASPTCGNASVSFAVTASPLVALLGGGGGVIGETPFTLSGAASYDPDGAGSALTYAWTCARLDGSSPACAARDGTLVELSGGAVQRAQLTGAAAPGALYLFTLTVSDGGGRSSSVNTSVTVLPGALPLVSVAGSAVLSGAKADPSKQTVLFANVTAFAPGAVASRWAVVAQSGVAGPLLNLSDPSVAATPVTSVSMVIRPGALAPGASYVLQLSATDAVGAVGSANASIRTSSPARDGWADVSPASGVALSTPFVLTAAGWSADADELPLTFSADYFVDSPAPAVSLTGGAFQASPAITVQLPAGLAAAGNVITLRLTVRSAFGATVSVNASAIVTWPAFEDAAAATAFVDDATARAAAALQSGDSSSALQVVGGLAALLNSDAGAGGDAGAAATQRAELLNIVAGAFNQSAGASMGAAAVESTAALVSGLVSSPSQLSSAGALAALSVLGSVASAGAAVSPAAAQSVAAALSSVALAPSAAAGSGGASPSNNFGAVLSVLDSLSSSQASGMSVPGQDAATVSTATIQMSVALCAVDADSPLFSAPLSAPGSNSSFDPLPPGALDAAGGAPVSSTFLSLAFDAHTSASGAPSNNTGGVTRLAFSNTDGAPLSVSNLTTPLLFTLPVSALAPGQRASCAWWDDAAGNYSTRGCASLPSPSPPGHELSFVPGFVASGPASLATAWNISGPLLDGCTPAFLDCTNATQRASGSLQVGAAGAVTCGDASDIIVHAYLGAGCALADTANASVCAWDAVTQAFTGTACVPASVTRCMCTHLTDFTSSQEVNIPVCSLSDLVGLNPADIGAWVVLLICV
jgi:hypothetical protein